MSFVLFFVATLVRAFFAMARSALVNMRRPRLLEMEQRGVASAPAIHRLTENSSRLLATAEVGAILSMVCAAGLATYDFIPVTEAQIAAWLPGLSGDVHHVLAFLVVMLAASFVLFVLGRLVPEAIAVRHAERISLAIVRPMQVLGYVFSPLVRFAIVASNLLSIPLGGQKRESTQLVTEEEIKTMVDAGQEEGLIEQEEKQMILSVLDFGTTVAREVMVPRIDIVAMDVSTPLLEAVDFVIKSGHSRVPIYRETVDDIIGILYAKDLLKAVHASLAQAEDLSDTPKTATPAIETLVRKVYFTPESKRVNELLQELQSTRVHVSVVVDEYGGTAGLVTIEDILEEIVGEIQDEYDTEEPEYVRLPEGNGYIVDAGMLISDANELLQQALGEAATIKLPEDESDTIGGFIYDQLGKVPVTGEVVHYNGLTAEVFEVSDRRILKVKITYEQPELNQQAKDNARDNNEAERDVGIAEEKRGEGRSDSGDKSRRGESQGIEAYADAEINPRGNGKTGSTLHKAV